MQIKGICMDRIDNKGGIEERTWMLSIYAYLNNQMW